MQFKKLLRQTKAEDEHNLCAAQVSSILGELQIVIFNKWEARQLNM